MDRHVPKLAIALAVQLLLVAGVVFFQVRGAERSDGLLFDFDKSTVDSITVTSGDGDTITLVKGADGWVLPGDDLPADLDKVTTLLDKLAAASASWPVATSAGAARRFEVDADGFQRHIALRAGDSLIVDLYTGTSPGFRKVHARQAGSDDVYAITFANYEAPALHDEWLDKTLLEVEGEATVISGPGWRLERVDDVWEVAALADGEATDHDRARDVASKITGLRVVGVAPQTGWLADADPLTVLTVNTADGEVSFEFFRQGDEGEFVVRRSDIEVPFSVAEYNAEPLIVGRADLLTDEVAASEEEEETPAEDEG